MSTGNKRARDGHPFEAVADEEATYIYRYAYPGHIETEQTSAGDAEAALNPIDAYTKRRSKPDGSTRSVRSVLLDKEMPPVDGLSLSGGGIRSAAFCLGVLEGLAEARLLSKFHYISSVSGGGYIGGWLSAWSYRDPRGIEGVEDALRTSATRDRAPKPIKHLLQYATYLAPQAGIFALDLWALITAYLRNLIITLGVTIPVLLVLASIPYMASLIVQGAAEHLSDSGLGGILLLFTILTAVCLLRTLSESKSEEEAKKKADSAASFCLFITVLGGIALALTLAGGGFTSWLSAAANAGGALRTALLLLLIPAVVSGFAVFDMRKNLTLAMFHALAMTASIVVSLTLLMLVDLLFQVMVDLPRIRTHIDSAFLAAMLSPLFWCTVLFLGETVRHGMLSRFLTDGDREWMARFAGRAFRLSIVWLLLCSAVYGVPYMMRWVGTLWMLGGACLVLVVVKRWYSGFFNPAVIAFVSGLSLVAAGWAVYGTMCWVQTHLKPAGPFVELACLAILALVLAAIAATIDAFVDINRFSMHSLYRDRLARTFLGASRGVAGAQTMAAKVSSAERPQFGDRNAAPFYDFDAHDSPRLHWMRSDSPHRKDHWMPVFLFNAALNKTWRSREPGRQVKAYSFVFSPFFCGSEPTEYCRAEDYATKDGGILLSTAMATSGAALSSKTGRFHSHPLGFLLTLCNLRLGWWLGNPSDSRTRQYTGPRSSLKTYFAEMFGSASEHDEWIHLSDGGHFENLGAFELLSRGCRRIVVVDGSADGQRQFGDLANLIRLAREELNINIEPLYGIGIGKRDLGDKGKYCTLFEVQYNDGMRGRLLYIKAAYYTGSSFGVPLEVQNYAMEADDFPHEPTVDQFFSSAQFDAYRRLGLHQMKTILVSRPAGEYDMSISGLMNAATNHERGPAPL